MNAEISGGFVINKLPLVRAENATHTAALTRPISAPDLLSVNRVQATPWRINTPILDLMRHGMENRLSLPGIPLEKPLPPPGADSYADWRSGIVSGKRHLIPPEVWETMSKEEQTAYKLELKAVHEHNAKAISKAYSFNDVTAVAHELRNERSIYFPHTRCWRGRIYPAITSGPHPQMNDIGKGVLKFAQGKRLGAPKDDLTCP